MEKEAKVKLMSVPKGYHNAKDGRIAKKGLYYYMNKVVKNLAKADQVKALVTEKALKESAKTC